MAEKKSKKKTKADDKTDVAKEKKSKKKDSTKVTNAPADDRESDVVDSAHVDKVKAKKKDKKAKKKSSKKEKKESSPASAAGASGAEASIKNGKKSSSKDETKPSKKGGKPPKSEPVFEDKSHEVNESRETKPYKEPLVIAPEKVSGEWKPGTKTKVTNLDPNDKEVARAIERDRMKILIAAGLAGDHKKTKKEEVALADDEAASPKKKNKKTKKSKNKHVQNDQMDVEAFQPVDIAENDYSIVRSVTRSDDGANNSDDADYGSDEAAYDSSDAVDDSDRAYGSDDVYDSDYGDYDGGADSDSIATNDLPPPPPAMQRHGDHSDSLSSSGWSDGSGRQSDDDLVDAITRSANRKRTAANKLRPNNGNGLVVASAFISNDQENMESDSSDNSYEGSALGARAMEKKSSSRNRQLNPSLSPNRKSPKPLRVSKIEADEHDIERSMTEPPLSPSANKRKLSRRDLGYEDMQMDGEGSIHSDSYRQDDEEAPEVVESADRYYGYEDPDARHAPQPTGRFHHRDDSAKGDDSINSMGYYGSGANDRSRSSSGGGGYGADHEGSAEEPRYLDPEQNIDSPGPFYDQRWGEYWYDDQGEPYYYDSQGVARYFEEGDGGQEASIKDGSFRAVDRAPSYKPKMYEDENDLYSRFDRYREDNKYLLVMIAATCGCVIILAFVVGALIGAAAS